MKFISILLFVLLLKNNIYPQLIIEENFDYPAGNLAQVSGIWVETITNNTRSIQVIDQNLSFPVYPSSTGKAIYVDGGPGGRGAKRIFNPVSGNNSSLYISFLLSVNDLNDLYQFNNIGDWFFCIHNQDGFTKAFIYLKKSYNPEFVRFGIGKISSTIIYDSTDISVGSTNLFVLKYKFSSSNDSVSFWINPSTSGLEPPPNIVNSTGTDINDISGIEVRQKEFSGNLILDGIRAARTWSEAPMPVELSSFTAGLKDNQILLKWRTETEVNNYGFEIEKCYITNNIKNEYHRIGFVNGNGNSNSPKEYIFTDRYPIKGQSYYRLKQIDNNGGYEYSNELEITNTIKEITLNLFPNPSNSSTTINYSLPEKQNIKLNVYNVLGEEQFEIFSGVREAGTYEEQIDLSRLSASVYFVVLNSSYKPVVKKGIVLK